VITEALDKWPIKVAFSSQMVIDALKELKIPITKKDESHALLF
jgi:hypothetical protein